jgi:hypothetical protein
MHHSAQKSTSTGWELLITSFSKFRSVNSFTFSLAIVDAPVVRRRLPQSILEVPKKGVNAAKRPLRLRIQGRL